MRLIATAVTLAVFCFSAANAEEFFAKIVKVDGSKVTINKGKKDEKVEDVTLTAGEKVKVCKGKWNQETKKLEAGDAIEKGLKDDMFSKIDEKGIRAVIITDKAITEKDCKITEIRIGGRKKKVD